MDCSLPPTVFSETQAQYYAIGSERIEFLLANDFPGIQVDSQFPDPTTPISPTAQFELSFPPHNPNTLRVLGIEYGISEQQVEDIIQIGAIVPYIIFPVSINGFEEGAHQCTVFIAAINPTLTSELTAAHCFSPFTEGINDARNGFEGMPGTVLYQGMARPLAIGETPLTMDFSKQAFIIERGEMDPPILAYTDSATLRNTGSRLQSTGHIPDFPQYTYETLQATVNDPNNRFYTIGYPGENTNEEGQLEPVLIPLKSTRKTYIAKGLGLWSLWTSTVPIGNINLPGISGAPVLYFSNDIDDPEPSVLGNFSSYWTDQDGLANIYVFTPHLQNGIPLQPIVNATVASN